MKETLRLIEEYDLFNQYWIDDIKEHAHEVLDDLPTKQKLIVSHLEKAADLVQYGHKAAYKAVQLKSGDVYEKKPRQELYSKFSDYYGYLIDLMEELVSPYFDEEKFKVLIEKDKDL